MTYRPYESLAIEGEVRVAREIAAQLRRKADGLHPIVRQLFLDEAADIESRYWLEAPTPNPEASE